MTSQPIAAQRLSLHHLTRWPLSAPARGLHPAVIALHGRGSHEGDLIGLADYLDPQLAWISPRAPLRLQGGYEWYRLEAIGVPEQASFAAALDKANDGALGRIGGLAANGTLLDRVLRPEIGFVGFDSLAFAAKRAG